MNNFKTGVYNGLKTSATTLPTGRVRESSYRALPFITLTPTLTNASKLSHRPWEAKGMRPKAPTFGRGMRRSSLVTPPPVATLTLCANPKPQQQWWGGVLINGIGRGYPTQADGTKLTTATPLGTFAPFVLDVEKGAS